MPGGKKKGKNNLLKKINIKTNKKDKIRKAEYDENGNLKTAGKKSRIPGIILRFLIGAILLCCAAAAAGGVSFIYLLDNYENIELANTFKTLNMKETTHIYAYDDDMGDYVEVEELFLSENRTWISYADIPQVFIDATVAIEDKGFYEHKGVDWPRFALAAVNNFLHFRGRFGASTITMQLVKNVTGNDQGTWIRKAQEAFNATYIETIYSKEDILELYLNCINYGGQIQGIGAASRFYFGKEPSQLSLIEVCSIVGITNNPGMYNPYYDGNREANLERAKLIASLMFEQEMISKAELDEVNAIEELQFAFKAPEATTENKRVSTQSYYVDAVIEHVLDDLQSTYGVSVETATAMLYQGGYKVYIPMDITFQNVVDSYYADRSNFPTKVVKKDDGKEELIQSSAVFMNYKTGDIIAIVGGIGEKEYDRGFSRATAAFRQVGSTIKPLAVYAPAIEYNIVDGNSALKDEPFYKKGTWPVNFTDYYRGIMPLRRALALSLNGPTVDLANQLGPENSYNFLVEKCGIDNLVYKKQVGDTVLTDITLGLSLGGVTNGLTVTEICSAYQIFPNDGVYNEPRFYLKVVDNLGNSVLEKDIESNVAISPQTAFIMRDLLYELVYDGYSSNARFSTTAKEKITCYGKTGTSTGDRDLWFCGFTSEYLGCIWMGYDSNAVASNIGSEKCAVLWSKIMRSVYDAKGLGDGEFNRPTGVTQVSYCKYSGKIATEICELDPRNTADNPVVMTSWVKTENVPTEECELHYPVYICEESGKIAHECCPCGSVYAVALLDDYREFTRTDLYIEDAQYVLPKLTKDDILYVSDRLPVYMNIYNNPEGWEQFIGLSPSKYSFDENDSDDLDLLKKYNKAHNTAGTKSYLSTLWRPEGFISAAEQPKLTITVPGLVMTKFATSSVMNAICTAHTPIDEPHLHPYNFLTDRLYTSPTHREDPDYEYHAPDPTESEVTESSDVSSDVSTDVSDVSSEIVNVSEPEVTTSVAADN